MLLGLLNHMNQFWEDKNVLITGAAGFIGSWLSKELIHLGAHVTALVRDWNPETMCLAKMIYETCILSLANSRTILFWKES